MMKLNIDKGKALFVRRESQTWYHLRLVLFEQFVLVIRDSMNWILFVLLIYTFIGALLIWRNMRGLSVKANPGEWIALIFFWPFSLRFFAQLAMVQSMIKDLEEWGDSQDQET